MTRPSGSRRAVTTPALAVRVSRSPSCQPSARVTVRSATRPEASIRPRPVHHVRGQGGRLPGRGGQRQGQGPGCAGPAARPVAGRGAPGMTGGIERAGHGRLPEGKARPDGAMRAARRAARVFKRASVLGDISPFWVSEGGLEPPCPLRALAPQASASAYSATRTRDARGTHRLSYLSKPNAPRRVPRPVNLAARCHASCTARARTPSPTRGRLSATIGT